MVEKKIQIAAKNEILEETFILKRLRVVAGYTQSELANRAGVTTRMARRWENGESMIPTGRLLIVARLLNVTVDKLLEAISEVQMMGYPEVPDA